MPTRLREVSAWLFVACCAAVPLGSALSNVLGILLLLTFLAAGGWNEHWRRWRKNPFVLASFALLATVLIGTLYSSGEYADIERMVIKFSRLLYVPIAVAVLTDERWERRAVMAWFGAMLLTLALSCLHAVWAFPLARATREAAVGDHYIFKHHITQNVMMSVFAVAALAQRWRALGAGANRGGRSLWWLAVAAIAVYDILFLVQGRAGYITLMLNVLVMAAVLLSSAPHRRSALVVGLLAIGVLGAATVSDPVRHRFQAALSEAESAQAQGIGTSVGQRMEYASRTLELIEARPIFGWGTGSYAREYCRVARTPEWCRLGAYNPHNQYLFLAAQCGLVGIAVLLGWLVCAGVVFRTLPLDLRLWGYALLATFIMHGFLDSPLYAVTESTWYPLLMGALAAHYGASGDSKRAV